MNASKYIRMNDLVALTGLSQSALRHHMRQGRIRFIKLGRVYLFDPEDLWTNVVLVQTQARTISFQPSRNRVKQLQRSLKNE